MRLRLILVLAVWLAPLAASAQTTEPAAPAPAPVQQEPERSDPDVRLDPLQPDFNLVALPTTLRMPAGKWAFRVTHRFTRSLSQGDFGDLASNLFGIDGGALIGLEVRAGLRPGTQAGIRRTSDRAIQLFAQQSILSEQHEDGMGLDVLAAVEGDDNLSEHHQAEFAIVLSKALGRAAVYAQPLFVLNANPTDLGEEHALMLGLGGRLRVGRTTYLVGEWVPHLTGYDPRSDQVTFAFESRAGGHLFQLNVGNGLGTTPGQLAGGALDYDNWFLGFSISRKFF